MGESTRLGGDLERLGLVGVEGVEGVLEGAEDALEKMDFVGAAFVGDAILGDDGTFG